MRGMQTAAAPSTPAYGERVLAVEPYSIERIPDGERHGSPAHLFPLWLGANLTIADFALGFLPIGLGLSLGATIAALVVGNVVGGALLALASAMGPRTGEPQMVAGRWSFGRTGGYLPGALNWVSTVGWFTINNILCAFGLQLLWPSLSFPVAALILAAGQVLLTIFGHNMIHLYERIMSVVLGVLFLITTVIAAGHAGAVGAWHPQPHAAPLALFAIVLSAAFSYIASWAPYASDYSRYLPKTTNLGPVIGWTFLGAVVSSLWLEILGAVVAILAGAAASNPIASLHTVMGGFGAAAVVAVILGGTAADALNLYSNALSARSLDIPVSRAVLTVAAGAVGLALSLYGSGHFSSFYEHFLLLLGYWVTPWLAILFVDFFIVRRAAVPEGAPAAGIRWGALASYALGIVISTPFIATPLYTGPLAARWGGADFSFYISFAAAGVAYALLRGRAAKQ